MTVLVIVVLGGVGAATRFVVDALVRGRWTQVLPTATLLINVTGSALLGLLTGAALYHGLSDQVVAMGGIGFCGGYTTFSTAMVETVRLIQADEVRRAVVNVVASVLLCLAAAALGVAVMWAVR